MGWDFVGWEARIPLWDSRPIPIPSHIRWDSHPILDGIPIPFVPMQALGYFGRRRADADVLILHVLRVS